MKKITQSLLLIISLSFIFILFNGAINAHPNPDKQKTAKPDLKIQSLTVNKIGKAKNGAIKVNIKVIIKNVAKLSSKTGVFQLELKSQDGKAGLFKDFKNKTIMALNTDPKIKAPARRVFNFQDTIPAGITRKYQAFIDPNKQVDEITKINNMMYAEFQSPTRTLPLGNLVVSRRAFPPCEGTDLIIYSVEIVRGDGDRICIRAKIKNLCAAACIGNMELVIDESAEGGSGISVFAGTRIEGEQTSNWSQWLCPYVNSTRSDHTYTVRIEATCSERPNDADNFLVVTLREGENSKTVNYGNR